MITQDKEKLQTLIDGLGIEYIAMFIPQSMSRNSQETHKSLNWRITLKRNAVVYSFDYSQGIGHLPEDAQVKAHHKGCRRDSILVADYERKCCETGKYGLYHSKQIPKPALTDILYCTVIDSDALDYSFEDWASNLGYDTDSIKAKSVYESCREEAYAMLRMFDRDTLEKLREAFQDY